MEIDAKKSSIIIGVVVVVVVAIYFFALRSPGDRSGKKFEVKLNPNGPFKVRRVGGLPQGWTPGKPHGGMGAGEPGSQAVQGTPPNPGG